MTVNDIQKNYIHNINLVKIQDKKYFSKKVKRGSAKKRDVEVGIGKIKVKLNIYLVFFFFKCLLNFRAHALQSELTKVSVSNFFKFQLQSKTSEIVRAFEKTIKMSHQNRAKKDIYQATLRTIHHCKIPYIKKKHFLLRLYCYILFITSLWYWK